jgi:hypothetical protein
MIAARWMPVAALVVALVPSRPAWAEPASARTGMHLAAAAADAWADDARLVWVENDAPVDSAGRADGWGYLYYSREKHAMRSWSVREARIVAAIDHTVSAEAPALAGEWQDSPDIAARAWDARGEAAAPATAATLQSLVLVRGVFAAETAWVAVFDDGPGPRLHVLLDAATGDVLKRWRG